MASDFVAFLRAISNVPMQPYRDALIDAGFCSVSSFGGTGNLLFSSPELPLNLLEQRVAEAVGAEAFVRSRTEIARIVENDPFSGLSGASVFLARTRIDDGSAQSFLSGGFEGEAPVIRDAQVYFIHPLQRPGHRSTIDLEREMGIRGTMRASRVMARVWELMEP